MSLWPEEALDPQGGDRPLTCPRLFAEAGVDGCQGGADRSLCTGPELALLPGFQRRQVTVTTSTNGGEKG